MTLHLHWNQSTTTIYTNIITHEIHYNHVCYLLLFSEANSRRSRSFMGKLTKVESLLVLRASEKRFRSGQTGGVKEQLLCIYLLTHDANICYICVQGFLLGWDKKPQPITQHWASNTRVSWLYRVFTCSGLKEPPHGHLLNPFYSPWTWYEFPHIVFSLVNLTVSLQLQSTTVYYGVAILIIIHSPTDTRTFRLTANI